MNSDGLKKFFAAGLLLLGLIFGCVSNGGNQGQDTLAIRVSKLVDETTKSEKRQERALEILQALGKQAVPHIVGHLGDVRPLASRQISLANGTPDTFEGFRHYSPDTVHDLLSAVLNQMTGESFVFVYNGASPNEREDNRRKWVDWCRTQFPTQALSCTDE
jgi:hypothetical protein